MKTRITFLLAGLIGGLVCVTPGPLLSIFTLTWGVGPAFFVAVVAGIITTRARRHLQAGFLRYIAGLVVCFNYCPNKREEPYPFCPQNRAVFAALDTRP